MLRYKEMGWIYSSLKSNFNFEAMVEDMQDMIYTRERHSPIVT